MPLEVKCGKLCTLATKFGQKNPLCKFIMIITLEVKKGKLCPRITIFCQQKRCYKFKMTTIFMVKMGTNIADCSMTTNLTKGH